jgi:hypothetical protein
MPTKEASISRAIPDQISPCLPAGREASIGRSACHAGFIPASFRIMELPNQVRHDTTHPRQLELTIY